MKNIFKKTEKTEEELLKAEERKEKIKEIAIKAGKITVGAFAFVGGALLVLIALGQTEIDVSTNSDEATEDPIETEVVEDEIVEKTEE